MELPDFTVEHLKKLPLRANRGVRRPLRPQGRTARATARGAPAEGEPSEGRRGRSADGRGVRERLGRAPRRLGCRGGRRKPGRCGRPPRQCGRHGSRCRGGPRGDLRLASRVSGGAGGRAPRDTNGQGPEVPRRPGARHGRPRRPERLHRRRGRLRLHRPPQRTFRRRGPERLRQADPPQDAAATRSWGTRSTLHREGRWAPC